MRALIGAGAALVLLVAPAMAVQIPAKQRCTDCGRDADRAMREKLLLRIDSLRNEFEHARLSAAERERLSKEMTSLIRTLQASLEEGARAEAMAEARAYAAPKIAIVELRPRGYLGVTFDGPSSDEVRNGERFIRFYQYPRITLVEQGSPAERAGVSEGDTLVALDGVDALEREFSLTKLLVPQSRITLGVKRDGKRKDLRVTVGTAPDYYVMRTMKAPQAPQPPEAPARVFSREAPPAPPAPPATGVSAMWVYSEGVGGAKVETLTEGLGKPFGASQGVLVLKVPSGSPAARSGLRDGDVILRAAGRDVATVRDLRSVLAEHEKDAGVKIVILRDRKQRDLTLYSYR